MMTAEALKVYASPLLVSEYGEVVGTADDPGAEVDKLVRHYMVAHPGVDYPAAFAAVKADPANADVVHAYALS